MRTSQRQTSLFGEDESTSSQVDDLRRSKGKEQNNNIESANTGYVERTTPNPNNPRSGEHTGVDGIGTEENEGWNGQPQSEFRTDGGNGDAPNAETSGMERRGAIGEQITQTQAGQGLPGCNHARNNWTDWPTVSPLCSGNDGLSARLDGITFSKWRNESIKAAGNAIVPQVALQIFKVIEQMDNFKQ